MKLDRADSIYSIVEESIRYALRLAPKAVPLLSAAYQ
jgi:hypothetical protein